MPDSNVRARTNGWSFARFLDGQTLYEDAYAVVMLNTPIPPEHVCVFTQLWNSAAIRVVADGGANHLMMHMETHCTASPTHICGDLDSITPSARAFFEARGVPIEHVVSQDSTDLQKSIQAVERIEGCDIRPLVIYGGLGSRLDQSMHTLHVLWQLAPEPNVHMTHTPLDQHGPDCQLRKRPEAVLVAGSCVTCLLTPGTHELWNDRRILGKTCGLLPLGVASAHVHTEGLQWNLRTCPKPTDTQMVKQRHLAVSCRHPIILHPKTVKVSCVCRPTLRFSGP